MRYDNRAVFTTGVTNDKYDPIKGEMVKGETKTVTLACNVSDLGLAKSKEIFGDFVTDKVVARFDRPIDFDFISVSIDDQSYTLSNKRLNDTVLYLVGDANG